MTDSAKLTHVIDVVIGKQMLERLKTGQPIALGFDAVNVQVRITFDDDAKRSGDEAVTPAGDGDDGGKDVQA